MLMGSIERVEAEWNKIDLARLLIWRDLLAVCSKSKREANSLAVQFRKMNPDSNYSGADIHARAPQLLALCDKMIAERKTSGIKKESSN